MTDSWEEPRPIIMLSFAVLVATGISPATDLVGWTSPLIGIAGAVLGAGLTGYELHRVQKMMREADERAFGYSRRRI